MRDSGRPSKRLTIRGVFATIIKVCRGKRILHKGDTAMKYVCDICGWEYDEELGYPEGGIAPGTKWEDIPEDFECPLCAAGKDQFSAA